jgi:dihydrofolate reductase
MANPRNIVFIARSLDGYIAGPNGELDWLHATPNPDGIDMGFGALMDEIDAIVMGRGTFEVVCGFDGPWPYAKPIYVLSNTLTVLPEKAQGKATLLAGDLADVLASIHNQVHHVLYVDGGQTIQSFLRADLIDELRITTIPILLGGGAALFGALPEPLNWEHVQSEVFLGQLVQDRYRRAR